MAEKSSIIARVERHPKGLVLITDEPKTKSGVRPYYFLLNATFAPQVGDTIKFTGKKCRIDTGGESYQLKKTKQNILEMA